MARMGQESFYDFGKVLNIKKRHKFLKVRRFFGQARFHPASFGPIYLRESAKINDI
jgi:hypothetical protein